MDTRVSSRMCSELPHACSVPLDEIAPCGSGMATGRARYRNRGTRGSSRDTLSTI